MCLQIQTTHDFISGLATVLGCIFSYVPADPMYLWPEAYVCWSDVFYWARQRHRGVAGYVAEDQTLYSYRVFLTCLESQRFGDLACQICRHDKSIVDCFLGFRRSDVVFLYCVFDVFLKKEERIPASPSTGVLSPNVYGHTHPKQNPSLETKQHKDCIWWSSSNHQVMPFILTWFCRRQLHCMVPIH